MKTALVLKLVLGLTAGILVTSWTKPDVAKAQTADCPINSVCVWTERNFTGDSLVFTPTINSYTAGGTSTSQCLFDNRNRIAVKLRRSIRNNTGCKINLILEPIPSYQGIIPAPTSQTTIEYLLRNIDILTAPLGAVILDASTDSATEVVLRFLCVRL